MKKTLAILALALLLVLTLAPAYYHQPADESPGQNNSFFDAYSQVFAITSSLFHLERDPSWTNVSYPFSVLYNLPKVLLSSAESRAPPV